MSVHVTHNNPPSEIVVHLMLGSLGSRQFHTDFTILLYTSQHSINYNIHIKGPFSQFGILGLQGKNWDFGITSHLNLGLQKSGLNLGLQDCTLSQFGITVPFEIGISGLQDTP